MAICHTVRRGDSLWGLACRYLGSGAKWEAIRDCHNREAAKPGRPKLLLPIKDPNLIYVGQLIMVPGNRKKIPPGTGTKHDGGTTAMPVNLKLTYTIGRDTPPIEYIDHGTSFTIKTEMSGEIAVELMSGDRFRHSLELLMSKDPAQAKFKLQEAYDPALCALTAKPEIGFDSGTDKIKIKAPIAAEAGLGPYTVAVHAESPLQLSGTLKAPTAGGTVEAGGRRYKYSADLEFKVTVTFEPKPRGLVEEPVRVLNSQKTQAEKKNPADTIDWQKTVKETKEISVIVAWAIVGAALTWYIRTISMTGQTTSMTPFLHTIDPNSPQYLRYAKRNSSGII